MHARGCRVVVRDSRGDAMAAIRKGQPLPNTVTHTYKGTPTVIQQRFDFYLPRMETAGYFVGNQSTIPGHRGGFGLFLIILLAPFTLGLSLLFLAVRPADTLVVTYQR